MDPFRGGPRTAGARCSWKGRRGGGVHAGAAEDREKWGNWGNLSVEIDQERFLNGCTRTVEDAGMKETVSGKRNAPGRGEGEMRGSCIFCNIGT